MMVLCQPWNRRGAAPVLAILIVLHAPAVVGADVSASEAASSVRWEYRRGGLTAEEVASRAQVSSFEVRARAEEYLVAKADVDQAIAAFVPNLSGSARYTRLSPVASTPLVDIVLAPPGTPAGPVRDPSTLQVAPLAFPVRLNQYFAQATLYVPLSDYLWLLPEMYAGAAGTARAAALAGLVTRLRVANDGRVLYYNWVRARMRLAVFEQALDQARKHLSDARHAMAVGASFRADALRAESQVASAELLVTQSRNLMVLAEHQLRTIMHDDTGRPYNVGEDFSTDVNSDIAGNPGATIDGEAMEQLWAEATRRRLEVHALQEIGDVSRERAKAARAAGLPRLSAVGNVVYAAPNPRFFPQEAGYRGTWDLTVQLSWAPTDLLKTETAQRSARARAAETDARRAALLDAIRMEVTQALLARSEAGDGVQTARRGLVAADESYRVRRSLYRSGRATSIEMNDAENEVTRARLDVIGTELDLRIARVRLSHALGRDIDNGGIRVLER